MKPQILSTIFDHPGLNKQLVIAISEFKNEPAWMQQLRLQAYTAFTKLSNPKWGPNLSFINFNDYYYFIKPLKATVQKWNDLPTKIRDTFEKLKIPRIEAEQLSGINNQYDSSPVYHALMKELADQHVLFCSMDEAVSKHPEIVKKYFGKLVPFTDNKYAALNSAVWSGGSFVYVPKNVILTKPLQSYFRINSKQAGQFERTLIIIGDNSEVHYMEGCTAPIYDKNNLHAAVVEVFVGKNAKFRYSTIQNWSDNVLNLVTKRAWVDTNGYMEWIDGNIGSKLNMKYPTTILAGDHAVGRCISIATANTGVIQDAGAKMIHLGKNTRSQILSKSIALKGGNASYRGLVKITKNAQHSHSDIVCDSIILDQKSKSDAIPTELIENNTSFIKHEARISDLDKETLFYLNAHGVNDQQARQLMVIGFMEPFLLELPLEYAVELNRLIKAYLV